MTTDPEKQRLNAEKRKLNLQKKYERRALKQKKKTGIKPVVLPPGTMPYRSPPAAPPVATPEPLELIGPEDLTEEDKCNYPPWKKYLEKYPMIHAIGRHPDQFEENSCTVDLTHFYTTDDVEKEEEEAEEQFNDFFRDIGFDQEDNTDAHYGPNYYMNVRTQYWD